MGKYTAHDNTFVDALIQEHMDRIVATVIAATSPLSIILRGSFGRGEGSVIIQGQETHFLSDYEIDVVTYSPFNRKSFKRISDRLTAELDVQTSLRWVRPDYITKLKVGPIVVGPAPVTIELYESRYGSSILYGEDFIHSNSDIDPHRIRLDSGIFLVLNRMAESMLYMTPTKELIYDELERYYWITKTILACADALLLLWGQYHFSYKERGNRFAALAETKMDFLPDRGCLLATLVAQATEYKLHPRPGLYQASVKETWQLVIPIIDLVFYHLVEQILCIMPDNYETFPAQYLIKISDHSAQKNPSKFLALKLLEIYRSIRIRNLPRGIFSQFYIGQIVDAIIPLLFHSYASENCDQVLRISRQWMKLLGQLKAPSSDQYAEQEYLRQRLTWYWKVYCYG